MDCDFCGRSFSSYAMLEMHYDEEHGPAMCRRCKRELASEAGALDEHIVWLHDGLAVSVPPQAIVVMGSLTILEKSYAEAASHFVHPPTATDRI